MNSNPGYAKPVRHSAHADARLAAIVASSDDAIIGKDLDGVITSWNKGAESIFGYTAEEIIGQPVAILIPPDKRDDSNQILEKIRNGISIQHYETVRVRKNGERIIVSLSVSPIHDSSGTIVGASKIARDITAQKRVQSQLLESEERFRATFEQAAVGLAQVGLDGSFLRVNGKLCEILGYRDEELLAGTFLTLTHPEDLAPDLQKVKALLRGEIETYSIEKRYFHRSGTVVWANLTVSVVRDERREPKYFISVIEDITERKAVLQSVVRQAALLDQAQEPIFAWELHGSIVYWNRAAKDLYGYSSAEAIGRRSHALLRTEFPVPIAEFEANLETNGSWAGELEHSTKDGRRIVVESRHKVVREEDRRLVLESNRDITDRKRVSQQIAEMNATLELKVQERTRQLNEANHELEAFAYSVSHDLRAPLRSVNGFGEILLREYEGKVIDAQGAQYIRKMVGAAARMGMLIQDLLALSHITRTEMKKERVDVSALANAVLNELRAQGPSREVAVSVQKNLIANADPRLLRVALTNLLANAWKFTGKTKCARIEFGANRQGRELVYFVRDNGAGFSMEYANNLFVPFQRLHSANEFEGSGIGLAIVQRVIHKHGGRIFCEAEKDRGAAFFFTLQ